MRKSLLSSLKIVAMMLAIDNDLHPKERTWFIKVSKNFGASHNDLRNLEKFLNGESDEELQTIIDGITDDQDRHRLLNFVQLSMRQDGIVKNREIQLFHEIHHLLNSRSNDSEYREFGRSLLKRDKEIAFWKTLGAIGTLGSSKVRGFSFLSLDHHFYPYDFDSDTLKNLAAYAAILAIITFTGAMIFIYFPDRWLLLIDK